MTAKQKINVFGAVRNDLAASAAANLEGVDRGRWIPKTRDVRRLTIDIDDDVHQRLRYLSSEYRVPVANVLRFLIDGLLQATDPKRP